MDSIFKEGKQVTIQGKSRLLRRNQTMFLPNERFTREPVAVPSNSTSDLALDDNFQLVKQRGRRAAFVDTKACIGEADDNESQSANAHSSKSSSTTSQFKSSSKDDINSFKTPSLTQPISRKKPLQTLRKQHTIADFSLKYNSDSDGKRRPGNALLKLMERKSKSREFPLSLTEAFHQLKPSIFHDKYIEKFKTNHWTEFIPKSAIADTSKSQVSAAEQQRQEAVWELIHSELIFLIDHILVLKHCFVEPLKSLQVEGYLLFVEPMELFGNLDELCYVGYAFCRDMLNVLLNETTISDFGKTEAIIQPLKRWCKHSKDGEIFHDFCLNYDSALNYLQKMRKFEQFQKYEKCCTQDPRCRRLQLTDLLISPLQHYAKIPLLITSIRKFTESENERQQLTETLGQVETSLRQLESKMKWLHNLDRLQKIQSQLIWPSLVDNEPRLTIPDFLRNMLSQQPCERMLANPKRKLLHEGYLLVSDGGKPQEMYAFLFDDFLLFTKMKKVPGKKSNTDCTHLMKSPTEGGLFVVYKQPISMDRFTIHDVGTKEATVNSLKNAFVLVLITRFQQITGICTIQVSSETVKTMWIDQLQMSQMNFQESLKKKLLALQSNDINFNKHSKPIPVSPAKSKVGKTSCFHPIELSTVDVNRFPSVESPNQTSITQSINSDQGEKESEVSEQVPLVSQPVFDGESVGSETTETFDQTTSLPWPRTLSYYKALSRDSLSIQSFQPSSRRLNSESMNINEEEGPNSPTTTKSSSDDVFAYAISERSQFTPPLSPVLHPPIHVDDKFKPVIVETDYARLLS